MSSISCFRQKTSLNMALTRWVEAFNGVNKALFFAFYMAATGWGFDDPDAFSGRGLNAVANMNFFGLLFCSLLCNGTSLLHTSRDQQFGEAEVNEGDRRWDFCGSKTAIPQVVGLMVTGLYAASVGVFSASHSDSILNMTSNTEQAMVTGCLAGAVGASLLFSQVNGLFLSYPNMGWVNRTRATARVGTRLESEKRTVFCAAYSRLVDMVANFFAFIALLCLCVKTVCGYFSPGFVNVPNAPFGPYDNITGTYELSAIVEPTYAALASGLFLLASFGFAFSAANTRDVFWPGSRVGVFARRCCYKLAQGGLNEGLLDRRELPGHSSVSRNSSIQ